MADTLVARVTGRDPCVTGAPVAIRLVMTDRTLLQDNTLASGDDCAVVHGYGPISAEFARALIARAEGELWLRRLYTDPETGELVAMDARSRRFPNALRELVELRDRTCRTPWCDAPIRHIDHTVPAAEGGPTEVGNAQGLCATPTGHTYVSRPPPLPGFG